MKKVIFPLFLFFAIIMVNRTHAETLTLTTYYPAPFGAYDRLRLVERDEIGDPFKPITDPCDLGTLYFYNGGATNPSSLYLCMEDDAIFDDEGHWGPIGVWTQNGNNIFPANNARAVPLDVNVGIGTTTPEAMLDVAGDIRTNEKKVITECRICFQESSGNGQCHGTRNSCSGWSGSPGWTPGYNDDTDGRSGWCTYHWKLECR